MFKVRLGTCSRLEGGVPLHVERQMVGPGESSLTQLAVERFVPRVFPLVPGQLIRPGEPPAAVLPLADVGLLPGVGSQVGLEVAGLGVGLPAPRVVAAVAGALPLEDDHHLAGLLVLTRAGEGETRGGGRRHQLQHRRGGAPAGGGPRGGAGGGGGGGGGRAPPRDDGVNARQAGGA